MRVVGRWAIAAWVGVGASCAGSTQHASLRPPLTVALASTSSLRTPARSETREPRSALARRSADKPHSELYVTCDDPARCPPAVGMLVVEETATPVPERCTASLISSDLALTASHCLRPEQRREGAACDGVFVSFPRTSDFAEESVACTRVVSVVGGERQDGLQSERAVLKLVRPLARGALTVDETPLPADTIVTVVSVTPHPIYGSTHSLTERLCRTASAERAEEALGPAAANVGWLSDCPIEHGNSGSPVLDYQGRLRAMVHGGTSLSSAYAVTSAPPRS